MSELQVKRAGLKVRKRDKIGRPYIGQQDVLVSSGILDVKSAERDLQLAADEATRLGEDVVGVELVTYDSHETPPAAWEPLLDHPSQERVFAGFYGPGAFPPESPRIRDYETRRKRGHSPSESA